jgi:hypothetical protein
LFDKGNERGATWHYDTFLLLDKKNAPVTEPAVAKITTKEGCVWGIETEESSGRVSL